jgi:hypothetical protein
MTEATDDSIEQRRHEATSSSGMVQKFHGSEVADRVDDLAGVAGTGVAASGRRQGRAEHGDIQPAGADCRGRPAAGFSGG